MCVNPFAFGDWNLALEEQFLEPCGKKTVYIASPLGAATKQELVANMHRARQYMFYASKTFDCLARAPHAYMPLLLNDFIPAERELGMEWGIQLLKASDILFVCGPRMSSGMAAEVRLAKEKKMPVVVFDKDLYGLIVEEHGKNGIYYDSKHKALAAVSPREYCEDV